jgi:CheY-like chemotaxis protein
MTLDLRMPGVDGIGVLRFLQTARLPTLLRVLVVSADTDDRLRESLVQGAHEVLRKPFADQELLAAVERLMAADPVS